MGTLCSLNAIQIRMPALRDRKDDIYLFFRKFTSDFSEKYRVCKITLTHDAIIALCNYRWPGNIRQLKNIAETVSALESVKLTPGAERCEINAETLRKYLPKEEETVLPAVSEAHGSAFNDDEKKMLIKAILDLRQEVDQLKMAVYSGGQAAQHRLPAVPAGPVHEVSEAREPEPYDEADWQEPDMQEQSPSEGPDLSLQKVSEDLIQKALEKHGGNRKLAAAELGISERTLYRRLAKETKR